jgi:hypothetical protein
MARRQVISDYLSPQWRSLFNHPPQVEPVADDARDPFIQLSSYAGLLAASPLEADEQAEAVEGMQLCERTHGYRAVAEGLRYAVQVVSTAVALVGVRARGLAERYGCANVGVLLGVLTEEWATEHGLLSRPRRFPQLSSWMRQGSPHPLLDDCRMGVRLAWAIDPQDADAPLAYSALYASARATRGEHWARALAERLMKMDKPQAAVADVACCGLQLPPLWSRYAFRQRRNE